MDFKVPKVTKKVKISARHTVSGKKSMVKLMPWETRHQYSIGSFLKEKHDPAKLSGANTTSQTSLENDSHSKRLGEQLHPVDSGDSKVCFPLGSKPSSQKERNFLKSENSLPSFNDDRTFPGELEPKPKGKHADISSSTPLNFSLHCGEFHKPRQSHVSPKSTEEDLESSSAAGDTITQAGTDAVGVSVLCDSSLEKHFRQTNLEEVVAVISNASANSGEYDLDSLFKYDDDFEDKGVLWRALTFQSSDEF